MIDYTELIKELEVQAEKQKSVLLAVAADVIEKLVDDVECKRGKWTLFENDIEQNAYECSACNDVFVLLEGTPQENLYNFCPNCGADMREREGE